MEMRKEWRYSRFLRLSKRSLGSGEIELSLMYWRQWSNGKQKEIKVKNDFRFVRLLNNPDGREERWLSPISWMKCLNCDGNESDTKGEKEIEIKEIVKDSRRKWGKRIKKKIWMNEEKVRRINDVERVLRLWRLLKQSDDNDSKLFWYKSSENVNKERNYQQ